jgi:fluoroquinolone resistance protein
VNRRPVRETARTDSEVRDEDWYAREIRGEQHDQVAFVDVDMTEVCTESTVFDGCTFRGVRFNASTHTDSAFLNCTFRSCTFFDTTFTRCKVVGSTFDRCTFSSLAVVGGDWSFAGLAGADLRKVRFEGTRLREADLTDVRGAGMSLRDVDLTSAWLHGADLTGADLRGAQLATVDPGTVTLAGAIIGLEQAVAIAEALGLDVRTD